MKHHVTYCMNVHPGITLAEQIANLQNFTAAIARDYRAAQGLDADTPFGVGLRFAAQAAEEFVRDIPAQNALRDILLREHLYAFTMNAFPYGRFHNTAVKEDVYRPTWCDPVRIVYTQNAAAALAAIMAFTPDSATQYGSISTAPFSYKTFQEDTRAAVANILRVAESLRQLRERTGTRIVLAIEPEPGCAPETTDETIDAIHAIFEHPDCTDALREHIGVCFDTAHLAVEFEDLTASAQRFTDAGIFIAKCQISAALEADDSGAGRAALAPYAEGVYLHQTIKQRPDGTLVRFADLPQAIASEQTDGAILRTHFHVPLFEDGSPTLRTTSHLVRGNTPAWQRLLAALEQNGCEHYEIETYTWDVWRTCADSDTDIVDGIVRELLECTVHNAQGTVF